MKYFQQFISLFDIPSGSAMGLLTLAFAWALFQGKDIGLGSSAAYSAAIAAFAATNIKGKADNV